MKNLILFLAFPWGLLGQCPVISQQPINQTDCETNSIRMIVGSNATQFQWEKKRPTDALHSRLFQERRKQATKSTHPVERCTLAEHNIG
jgi:hypothetical protein